MRYRMMLVAAPHERFGPDVLADCVGKVSTVTDAFYNTKTGKIVDYEVVGNGMAMYVTVDVDGDLCYPAMEMVYDKPRQPAPRIRRTTRRYTGQRGN